MSSTLPPKHLDKRTSSRYIKRGNLTETELNKHLKSLPDLAEQADKVTVVQPGEGGKREETEEEAAE